MNGTSRQHIHSLLKKKTDFLIETPNAKTFKESAAQQSCRRTKQHDGAADFHWSERPEPHRKRNAEINKKYGKQIRALGLQDVDRNLKYVTIFNMTIPLAICAGVMTFCQKHQDDVDMYWTCWGVWTVGLWLAGIAAHSIFLAVHEVSHMHAFRQPFHNDLLNMFVQLPLVLPYAMAFKDYHMDHHRFQGWDGIDTDIPTAFECKLFQSTLGKLFFVTNQILFYAVRPMLVVQKKFTLKYLLNWTIQLTFNYLWYTIFGIQGVLFLLLSVWAAGSWNPVAGHFISEHYVFDPEGNQETYSYYGFWNIISYNVGCHNEHHDFPGVPGSKLPELRKIAPEYYESLKQTPSWFGTMIQFIRDPSVGSWSRVKREKDAYKRHAKGDVMLPTSSIADAVYPEPTLS